MSCTAYQLARDLWLTARAFDACARELRVKNARPACISDDGQVYYSKNSLDASVSEQLAITRRSVARAILLDLVGMNDDQIEAAMAEAVAEEEREEKRIEQWKVVMREGRS